MIKISNVYFKYNDKSDYVIKNLSLDIDKNGLYFIMGKSGCGKSTLLNLLSGFITPNSGNININDKCANFFQDYKLFDFLTSLENIMFPLVLKGISHKKCKEISLNLLKKYNLEYLQDQKVNTLSGGEKSRVNLLRLLNTDCKILLIDEATGELDSENSKILLEDLIKIKENKIILFVTHNEELCKQYGDKTYYFYDGKLCDSYKEVEVLETANNESFAENNFDKEVSIKQKKKTNLVNLCNKAISNIKSKVVSVFNFKKKPKVKKVKLDRASKKEKISFKETIKFSLKMCKKNKLRIVLCSLVSSFAFSVLAIVLSFKMMLPTISTNIYNSFPNSTVATVYKEIETSTSSSSISFKEKIRLNEIDRKGIESNLYPSLSYFLPSVVKVTTDESVFNVSFVPGNLSSGVSIACNSLLSKKFNNNFSDVNVIIESNKLLKYNDKMYSFTFTKIMPIESVTNEISLYNVETVYYDYKTFLNIFKYLTVNEVNSNNDKSNDFDETQYVLVLDLIKKCDEFSNYEDILISKDIIDFFNDATKQKFIYNSTALDTYKNINGFVDSFFIIIFMFLIVSLIITYLFEYYAILTLYQDNLNNFAIVKSFKNPISSRKISDGIMIIFYFCSCLMLITFTFLTSIFINSLIDKIGLNSFGTFTLNTSVILVLMFLMYLFAFYSSRKPIKNMDNSDLLLTLRKDD